MNISKAKKHYNWTKKLLSYEKSLSIGFGIWRSRIKRFMEQLFGVSDMKLFSHFRLNEHNPIELKPFYKLWISQKSSVSDMNYLFTMCEKVRLTNVRRTVLFSSRKKVPGGSQKKRTHTNVQKKQEVYVKNCITFLIKLRRLFPQVLALMMLLNFEILSHKKQTLRHKTRKQPGAEKN